MRKYRGIRYETNWYRNEFEIYYYIAGERLTVHSYISKQEVKAKAFSAIDFYREAQKKGNK